MAFFYLGMDATTLANEVIMRENAIERAILRNIDSPFDLDEVNFKKLYRLTPDMTHTLIDSIGSLLTKKNISALSAESQVLAALRFYATGCYQRPVGEQCGITMSQSSISRSIHCVTEAINSKIFRQYVRFPMTEIERQAAHTVFRTASLPFDGAIGAIDCTHVAILGPAQHEEAYVNHHGYHSINVQMICDANLKILNVNARYPGARHDAYIWSACAARQVMKRAYERGDRHKFLIGDSGYPLEPWLMTPLPNSAEGTPSFRYNKALCQARNCVERLFGVLKNKFRCLSKQRVLMYEPGFAGQIVNACAVLHNMRHNDSSTENLEEFVLPNTATLSAAPEGEEEIRSSAVAKRIQDRLILEKFS